MGYNTDKKRCVKEGYSFGNENKPNGFVEDRAKPQGVWGGWSKRP